MRSCWSTVWLTRGHDNFSLLVFSPRKDIFPRKGDAHFSWSCLLSGGADRFKFFMFYFFTKKPNLSFLYAICVYWQANTEQVFTCSIPRGHAGLRYLSLVRCSPRLSNLFGRSYSRFPFNDQWTPSGSYLSLLVTGRLTIPGKVIRLSFQQLGHRGEPHGLMTLSRVVGTYFFSLLQDFSQSFLPSFTGRMRWYDFLLNIYRSSLSHEPRFRHYHVSSQEGTFRVSLPESSCLCALKAK